MSSIELKKIGIKKRNSDHYDTELIQAFIPTWIGYVLHCGTMQDQKRFNIIIEISFSICILRVRKHI